MIAALAARRWARAVFWVYAAFIFVGTHWPKLEIPGTGRPDLFAHVAVFGLWAALFIACRFFGPALSWRNIGLGALVSAAYSGIDEGLQAIPFIRRVPAWDDWGANLLGVGVAAAGAAALRLATAAPILRVRKRAPEAPEGHGFQGPVCWAASALAGLVLGACAAWIVPGAYEHGHAVVPLWLVAPFAVLLLSIAVMPFINRHFWHAHFADFAFFLGSTVAAYYLVAFREPGDHTHDLPAGVYHMLHAGLEYYAFIALVGGLYVASGGILVDVRARGRPAANTALLAAGAVMANIVGTTGASMLLIRPFIRMNQGRLRPVHLVMFIFIVSNCGGCLTPIGDPPLYLGFINGVPFFWTIEHLWQNWLLVNACLLGAFYLLDRRIPVPDKGPAPAGRVRIRGTSGMICLALIILGVFIDPVFGMPPYLRVGATFQLLVTIAAWRLAPRDILAANNFTLFPVKEVGLLFLGIFATMVPALGYLSTRGPGFEVSTPTAFYFGTGALSAVLDNAPTYMQFLQVALANPEVNLHAPRDAAMTIDNVRGLIYAAPGVKHPPGNAALDAISAGAVFFGAMTYIGNGPNFMVKSIAEASGIRMPSFFGYLLLACVILLPILVLNWVIFIV